MPAQVSHAVHADVGAVARPGRPGLLRVNAELVVEDEQVEGVPQHADDAAGDGVQIGQAPVVEHLALVARESMVGLR